MVPDQLFWEVDTPAFILDEEDLRDCISGFQNALKKHFLESVVGYSVKTNGLPYCLSVARDMGCFAEVVSYHEYALALKCGFDRDKIIYNGPLKSKETFLSAIIGGSVVNIETWREIEWLKDLPNAETWKVGIRLNIDITKVSPDNANHEDDDSRFGFSAESGDFNEAINRISTLGNILVDGIHIHRTSKARRVGFYRDSLAYAIEVLRKYKMSVNYFDIGGGFFGPMQGKPTFNDYASAIKEVMNHYEVDAKVLVEPGNALVASGFYYVLSVIDVKKHNGKCYVTTDGTRNDVDPFFHKTDYFKSVLTKRPLILSKYSQVIGGLTCLEYDRLMELPSGSEALSEGDRILLKRVGAYTLTLTPLFIHFFPRVYVLKDGELRIARNEWDEGEFLMKSNY